MLTNATADRSYVFAHKMLWYLQSCCLKNPTFVSEIDVQRVQRLIKDVAEYGAVPAVASAGPPSPTKSELYQLGAGRESDGGENSREDEALLPRLRDDHYATFEETHDIERGLASSAVPSMPRIPGTEPFELETAFLRSLANVSSNLRAAAYNSRNDMVSRGLT